MAMSTSGSQSGLYNILVDEEDHDALEQHLQESEQFIQGAEVHPQDAGSTN